ncbi:MAG: hypothetical protein DYH14_07485 [Betaproteobacteria bacterium PRO3]|nr:hypothetical protein [Betaproteobacteria bacterium PRO3]
MPRGWPGRPLATAQVAKRIADLCAGPCSKTDDVGLVRAIISAAIEAELSAIVMTSEVPAIRAALLGRDPP